jgi:hypothetical protein
MSANVTFPVLLDRLDGSTVLEGDLTALGGIPGGLGADFAYYTLSLSAATGAWAALPAVSAVGYMYVDPVAFVGQLVTTMSLPVTTYAALAKVLGFDSATIAGLPDSTDTFNFALSIVLADVAGANVATLVGSVDVAAHTPTGAIAKADLTFTAVAGADLSWDVTMGSVSTTAGGVYAVLAQLTAEYD